MREKLAKLMYGRYGVDELSKAMLWVAMFCCIVSILFKNSFGTLLYYVAIVLLIIMYIRMFSRNIQKCYQQNIKYLEKKSYFVRKFKNEKAIFSQRRYYHFYRCPRCNQRIRIPRGKGRIEIRCPKCSETFIKKS